MKKRMLSLDVNPDFAVGQPIIDLIADGRAIATFYGPDASEYAGVALCAIYNAMESLDNKTKPPKR